LKTASFNVSNCSNSDHVIHDPIVEEDGIEEKINNDLEPVDSIEGAGLRSRIQEMQQRVAQLEKEKVALSMSKAPLEARFRQKEEAWIKEQKRLHDEIENLKLHAKEADERYRSLEHKYNEVEAIRKQLLLEIRRQGSNTTAFSSDDVNTWSRQVQNDRDAQELRQRLRSAEEEIKSLKLEKVSLESEVHATQLELGALVKDYNDLEEEYRELEASKSQASDAQIQLEVLTREHIATAAQLNAVCSDYAAMKSSSEAALEEMQRKWKDETSQLKFDIAVLKTREASNVDSSYLLNTSVEDDAVLRARIEERDARIADLEAQLIKGEQLRRIMHNRIQELRGNIRVFVRTRPFLPGDGNSTESSITIAKDDQTILIKDRSSKSQEFTFDKVFSPAAGQDAIFAEVSEFVQSALDGYHVCLFSYGQTGSGKTHTMQGSGNNRMRGIIPRAVEQILTHVKDLQSQKWKHSINASFLEIYNEDLRDLLVSMVGDNGTSKRTSTNSSGNVAKLAIKHDASGKSYVEGLTKVMIETNNLDEGLSQLESLMTVATRARTVASTNMNSHSSRSHSVFMLHLRGHNADSDTIVEGALNLCDLAGSERLDRSGAASDAKTLKETQAINKSLSSLGDVFNALANKSKNVPYRNSKLTYLLQDCLSGDGKALMFVNLSPTIESSNESLCSLRFAQRVNQIELGKPTKHVQYGGRS
jgi:kinesin family protein C1